MLKTVNTYLKKQQRKQNTSVTLFMPKGPHYDRDKAQFPVTSKKMIFFFLHFINFLKSFLKRLHSQSLQKVHHGVQKSSG